jgi:hypothetical protein
MIMILLAESVLWTRIRLLKYIDKDAKPGSSLSHHDGRRDFDKENEQ